MSTYQSANVSAQELGFKDYADYLQYSDQWHELKANRIENAKCCNCSRPERLLAHHTIYRRLIDVTVDDLEPMCFDCHDLFHVACRKLKVNYIGMKADRIRETIQRYKVTDEYKARQERLKKRAQRKIGKLRKKERWKKKQRKPQPLPRWKIKPPRSGNFDVVSGRLLYRPHI